ncbi:MAG TPA: TetR/AcrR family transcriptional regulator [Bacillota bacterium]|nr:TetR/AcrR family transcriptional regulator [Bacillota bacterium]
MDERKKGTRRRGEILEEAILLAAWEELSETGYTQMTMESVATRAGTNKSVLYRRWSDKSELVIAAIHKHLPKIPDEIPDTGNLRSDVYGYLHGILEPLKLIGVQTIRGLIMEPMVWRNLIASIPQMIERKSENKLTVTIAAILKNAELRGEIRSERLTPRIISLPLQLLQCEIITTLAPISDETLAEIVDDIFIPLVSSAAAD